METYDFIMAGGGLAGLSLAYQLHTGPFADRSILIIDNVMKTENDRTWCCWTREPLPFDHLVSHRWDRIGFYSSAFSSDIDLAPYAYQMIRGIDFYQHTLEVLRGAPQVTFLHSTVEEIENHEDHAVVHTEHGDVRGSWVFDSLFLPEDFRADTTHYHYLMQHFRGWEIRTRDPVFDPTLATLFDFRTDSDNDMRFVYVLPYSSTEALVEYTLFSANLLTTEAYDEGNRRYIEEILGVTSYEITHIEKGIIPMTDQPFPRRLGSRTMAIGTKGGRVKASTGFAFYRTQRDTQQIVHALQTAGSPFAVTRPPRYFATLDTMLLQILYRRGELSEKVFGRLFARNPIDRLLRFLNEETTVWETLALMATVPWGPFIAAWFRVKVLGRL
jgi:lycopene beta-cyclase